MIRESRSERHAGPTVRVVSIECSILLKNSKPLNYVAAQMFEKLFHVKALSLAQYLMN